MLTARIYKGTFIHECNIQYSIIYPTGLRDKQKTALRQGVSCSINCILPAGKSIIYAGTGVNDVHYSLVHVTFCGSSKHTLLIKVIFGKKLDR